LSKELSEVSERHGLFLSVLAVLLRGWAQREVEEPKKVIEALRAFGQGGGIPYWSSSIAESDAACGRFDAAIERLSECLEMAQTMGELYYVPELYRLKGEYLVQRDAGAEAAAMDCFHQAISLARTQSAKMPELRATMALCRILQRR